ncbi:hydrolase [Terrisporobacter petrolearius]|uniref:hydrolase n=1 Tax=Terrisporobacter petrolearius TaxID=1460447 RepID=UPI002F411E05
MKEMPTAIDGTLRKSFLRVPEVIRECSGINVFGKRIKSLVYTTDLAIIRNVNADAILAVYPFTPQPIITQALLLVSDVPVFTGVGGGLTNGLRSVMLGTNAEIQGAIGVVVNAPTSNETLKSLSDALDIPVVVSIISEDCDIDARVHSGASILNVSASKDTPKLVAKIRKNIQGFLLWQQVDLLMILLEKL